MKKLPTEFVLKKRSFRLMQREGDVVLVEARIGGGTPYFEIHKLRKVAEHTFPNGRTTKAHEALQPTSRFGYRAWAYNSEAEAREKFAQIARFE